ncbi:MAG: hypothetical protein ACTSU2_10110 [Promethearchaeota archaeon]
MAGKLKKTSKKSKKTTRAKKKTSKKTANTLANSGKLSRNTKNNQKSSNSSSLKNKNPDLDFNSSPIIKEIKKEISSLNKTTEFLKEKFKIIEKTLETMNNSLNILSESLKSNQILMQKVLQTNNSGNIKLQENENLREDEKKSETSHVRSLVQPQPIIENKESPLKNTGVISSKGYQNETQKLALNKENFPKVLEDILKKFHNKNENEKYVKIKDVKDELLSKYDISDEELDKLILDLYFNEAIELSAGTGDYSIKDIYDNIYHNIGIHVDHYKIKNN